MQTGAPRFPTLAGRADKVVAATPAVAARMSRQRRRDTAPELLLRRELHRRGFRFRVDHPLPGLPRRRADVVFTRVQVAVFVDGCFWHMCPVHRTMPQSNGAWWAQKLARNVARDKDTDERLREAGWEVVRAWEHEDPFEVADRVVALVTARRDIRPLRIPRATE